MVFLFLLGSNPHRRRESRASSSSQLHGFTGVLSRHSSCSITSSWETNLSHLTDRERSTCVNIIEDAFLRRSSPELALQIASKFRMCSYDLIIFSYAHRLYLNLLSPAEIRTRLSALTESNSMNPLTQRLLNKVDVSKGFLSNPEEQPNSINDQKHLLIDRLANPTSEGDHVIPLLNTLFKISELFRIDSSKLLDQKASNDPWIFLERILSYPSSSFPTKIKLAQNFCKQLQLENQRLVDLLVDETEKTLQKPLRTDSEEDYHCWSFDPNDLASFKEFIGLLHDKKYDAIGKELIERSKMYEDKFQAQNQQGL